jgi:hypothetical protein
MRAKAASEIEDLSAFKIERAHIVEYLETEYKRILETACRLNDFIKENKCEGGLFDASRENHSRWQNENNNRQRATALVLLQEYAESFKRDIPLEIKTEIRLHQSLYDSFYADLWINTLLQQVNTAFETRDHGKFAEYFIYAVDELDEEYLEIREARKQLFKGDILALNQLGCDIDVDFSRCDEKVVWSINEPFIGPEEGSGIDYSPILELTNNMAELAN